MLAEIQGKISRIGTNLSERLEDNLTGNVFGALRYIPFSIGLGEVLASSVYPKSLSDDIRKIKCDFWADKFEFWPYDRDGEIDAMLDLPTMMIGIEVKLHSGLSSDDDVENGDNNQKKEEMKKSINQLARESRILARKGQDKRQLLLFIAERKSCKDVYENISGRGIIEQGVEFGYISWQDFLRELKLLQVTDSFHQVIIKDLINLLTRKGFEDFVSMSVMPSAPVNKHDFYKFDLENKIEFEFKTNLLISEGVHYEFSR